MAAPPESPQSYSQSYYITEAWHGLPKYVCPACGYDTLRLLQLGHHQEHCAAFRAMQATQGAPEPPDEPDEEPQPVPVPDEPEDDEAETAPEPEA
jgi:hypothetical protein